jgi:uncharacterized membrane protein YphA (DoxX/SURF4 family)
MIAHGVRQSGGRDFASVGFLLRLAIGSLFLASGIAKIPIMPRFVQAIVQITQLGSTISLLCAGSVIGSELALGSMLLLGIRVSTVARSGMVLAGIFLAVLGNSIVRGEELACNCFGVLGLSLPNRLEFLVDLFVLLGLICVAGTTSENVHRWRRVWNFALVALVIPSVVFMSAERIMTKSGEVADYGPYLRRAELEREGGVQITGSLRLLLFIDIRGLQCSVCFDDFIALYDSLSSGKPRALSGGAILALRGGSPGESPDDRLRKQWARETGVTGPVLLIESGEFDALTSGKNLALVVNNSGRAVLTKEMPMGESSRKELIAALGAK